MQFISESIIDQKAATVGATDDLSEYIQNLKDHQPALLAYLFSESFELLTEAEKEYTMFLVLVVWESVWSVHPEQDKIEPTAIEKAEDSNWEKLDSSKSKDFRDKLNVFFEDTPQEDLLAFVEDALTQDEEDMVSNEGREYKGALGFDQLSSPKFRHFDP